MSLEGMDVDQAQGLARQLDGYGQALAHISAALAGLAAELSHSWRGPASAIFQQQCTAQYRPALSGAAQALSDMHAHLAANIHQQVRTSAADAGGGGGGVVSAAGALGAAFGAGLSSFHKFWDNKVDPFLTPLDKLKEVSGNDFKLGDPANSEYGMVWKQLMKLDHESPLLAYKQSPIMLALHDDSHVQLAGRILRDTHADTALKVLGPVGTAMGLITVGGDVRHAIADAQGGHYTSAGGHLVDATAEALKTRGLVGYLAGADIVIWKENYDLASQIDWKQGVPNPFDAGTFREDYLPTFESMPGQVAGVLKKAFL
jgi:uncharacterized protein YukE